MNAGQPSSSQRRSTSALHQQIVSAFALDDQLACLLPPAKLRAMRQSEKKAARMTLGEKQAQVARFQLVM